MTIEYLPIKHLFRPISRIDVYDLNGTPTGYLQKVLEQKDLDGNLTRAVYVYIYCCSWLYEEPKDDKAIPIDITEDKAISATHYINENVKYPFGNISCTLLGLSGDKKVLIVTIDVDVD